MSHSLDQSRAAVGQALLAGHAFDGPADIIVIPESYFLREPAPRVAAGSDASGEDWTDGFDIHLGVYARF